jgi:hypothetical protein
MKKNLARLFLYLILFTIFGVAASLPASAQSNPVFVTPTSLYRFEVSYWDGGHLLTGIYQEGPANGYTFDSISYPSFDAVGIYVPPAGYTPAPSSGLVPLHRWTVIQNGWRTHYYYSTYYTQQPSDRYYNGIAGYVFPPGTTEHHFTGVDGNGTIDFVASLHQLSVWYSQDLGFWNGYGAYGYGFVELPPNRSGKGAYAYQGIIAALPVAQADPQFPRQPPLETHGWDVLFNPPPPPPPPPPSGSCNASLALKNKCSQLGGFWDDESCSCQY